MIYKPRTRFDFDPAFVFYPDKKDYLTIFLSGGMSGLTKEQARGWRKEIAAKSLGLKVKLIDPSVYDVELDDDDYQEEGHTFCLRSIMESDIVVVNLDYSHSIGTAQEIMFAWMLNKEIWALKTTDDSEKTHYWYFNKIDDGRIYHSVDDLVKAVKEECTLRL